MSMIHVYGSSVASADAVATIDVPADGVIEEISWCGHIGAPASGAGAMTWELSFGSVRAPTSNDARQIIDFFTHSQPAANETGASNKVTRPGLKVFAGERIYLHSTLVNTAPGSCTCHCMLNVNDKIGVSRVRR